jgi:hypothetical protein
MALTTKSKKVFYMHPACSQHTKKGPARFARGGDFITTSKRDGGAAAFGKFTPFVSRIRRLKNEHISCIPHRRLRCELTAIHCW